MALHAPGAASRCGHQRRIASNSDRHRHQRANATRKRCDWNKAAPSPASAPRARRQLAIANNTATPRHEHFIEWVEVPDFIATSNAVTSLQRVAREHIALRRIERLAGNALIRFTTHINAIRTSNARFSRVVERTRHVQPAPSIRIGRKSQPATGRAKLECSCTTRVVPTAAQ